MNGFTSLQEPEPPAKGSITFDLGQNPQLAEFFEVAFRNAQKGGTQLAIDLLLSGVVFTEVDVTMREDRPGYFVTVEFKAYRGAEAIPR